MFSVNENKTETSKINKNSQNSSPITSPISQGKLVSKVNALTSSTTSNPILNPQNIVFNTDKGTTLNYKNVVDTLVNIEDAVSPVDYCNKIYAMISQSIDTSFFAIGLFKEKSNCINLRLQDKLGNNYSTKVFTKDEENPIVKVFNTKETLFIEKENYLKLSYYKNYSTAILPLISVNKCIGVFIIADANARQSAKLYSLIAKQIALVIHN